MYNCHVSIGQKVYKQVVGTATGTAAAPTFASLYVHHKYRPVFLRSKGIIMNRRYIDDGFVIGRCKEDLEKVAHSIHAYTNFSITWSISDSKVIYLNLEIYEEKRFKDTGSLDLAVYSKPVCKFLYLHRKSNHPPHVFTGVVKGELIRYLRNTSDLET